MGIKRSLLILAYAFIPFYTCSPTYGQFDDLSVQTNLFSVKGTVWPNSTSVRFFGGIPYAEPPVGAARFRPPIIKRPSEKTIEATYFGPSCIQYNNGALTVYTEYLSGFLLTPGQEQSEDCLTLNVWAPRATKVYTPASSDLLPVMIWIHGGGFTSGGSASPYKYGDRIARDHQVIVVSMNYRLNIFGFPSAQALGNENLNPGLMDQRKAVEWVYQNIHAFGGDANRMVLFGQSAGSMSVDKYIYAYPTDPLVSGFIAQSGLADCPIGFSDPEGTNFTYVASQLGCNGSSDKDKIFSCMQKANATDIIQVYNKYNASNNGGASLSFAPQPDNMTSFSNYTDRQARGLFAQLPTIIS